MNDIESKVREAFDLACTKDMSGCWRILTDLTVAHDPDLVKEAMQAVDPHRLVWDAPVRPGEIGVHGYPMVETRYRICSDIYGNQIDMPNGEWDMGFVEAVRTGYEDGTLHDTGHLVVNRKTGSLAFLVAVTLDDCAIPTEEVMSEISARHGIALRAMAWPNKPAEDGAFRTGRACIAVQLDRPEQFVIARRIAVDIVSAAETSRNGPGSPGASI